MKTSILAVLLGLLATEVRAQAPAPALELPVGARVRLRTQSAPGGWIKGVLASADSERIALVPEGAPPIGANKLGIPRETVTRLELSIGRKKQWLGGLVIGAALGVALGFTTDVDPSNCGFDSFCSRGEAVAASGATLAGIGALVGCAFKRDVWVPVGLDALGPPPVRLARAGVGLRAVPGGVSLDLSVRF
jgi:hypothetical protein